MPFVVIVLGLYALGLAKIGLEQASSVSAQPSPADDETTTPDRVVIDVMAKTARQTGRDHPVSD